MNDTIKNEVLAKIAVEKVTPTSRWYFTARHLALWAPGILVTLLGSVAVAAMLFGVVHAGWEYRSYTNLSVVGFLRTAIPLLWLGSFILFGALIVRTLRLTARGYRYTAGFILLISFISSVVVGVALFAFDIAVRNPLVRFSTERSQKILWNAPEQGRLAGVVTIDEEGVPILADATGKRWVLHTLDIVDDATLLVDGVSVRIVGELLEDNSFVACMVIPWDLSPFPPAPPTIARGIPPRERLSAPLLRCHEILERTQLRRERKPMMQS